MISQTIRRIVPETIINRVRNYQRERNQARIHSLAPLSQEDMEMILRSDMGLKSGDLVFVHSSVDQLNLTFPFFQLLGMLREIVGDEGTLVFPTYPRLSSYRFLCSGEIFDVRKTPSYTGILSEFARRQRNGLRSLHPTKSVVALGPLADYLTRDHHRSPYPYDAGSPYYRTIEKRGKVVGIGVGTFNLSLVHSVDDIQRDQFPVLPYHSRLFEALCIDREGIERKVETFAHDMRKMDFDIPAFMAEHIDPEVSRDFSRNEMRFFVAQAEDLFRSMCDLAARGVTIYRRKHYKR